MANFAITASPVVGVLILCMLCASAGLDSDGECSDASASGVCPKSGKSMLQMSSSFAAVHSEVRPDLGPAHHRKTHHKNKSRQRRQQAQDWSVIDATHGCEVNDDGINRTKVGIVNSLESCQGMCVIDPQCRAIDFFRETGHCNTFSQPCSTPQVAHKGVSSHAYQARIAVDQCNLVKMIDKSTHVDVALRPRVSPVRVVDFSQIAFEHELPLLRMRLAEMGPYVDEFHIAEGDHDFAGRPKEFVLPRLLDSDPDLAQWRSKIVHHKVKSSGHQNETVSVARQIAGSGVLFEGDLDEIISRTLLHTIKHCVPVASDGWNASVQMPNLQWNMGWSPCKMCYLADATVMHDLDTKIPSYWDTRLLQAPVSKREDATLSYVKQSPYLVLLLDGRPAGWHVSWTFDGAKGIANKWLYGWSHAGWKGNPPEYVKPHMGNAEELANFFDEKFLPNPLAYEDWLTPSNLTLKDLPESVVQDPDKYKVQLGSRLYEMLTHGKL